MILYQALSSYQILECILHRRFFYLKRRRYFCWELISKNGCRIMDGSGSWGFLTRSFCSATAVTRAVRNRL